MSYNVTDKTGRIIEKGDTVTDFRGDTATFEGVERGVEYNGTAKVIVTRGDYTQSYYDRVFSLTVETVA